MTESSGKSHVDIHALALNDRVQAVERELNKNPERVNEKDEAGLTLLSIACARGSAELVLLILNRSQQALHISKDPEGKTALHAAAALGRKEIVSIILDRDISMINYKANNGWTPLHYASLNGHIDTTVLLLEKGIDSFALSVYNSSYSNPNS